MAKKKILRKLRAIKAPKFIKKGWNKTKNFLKSTAFKSGLALTASVVATIALYYGFSLSPLGAARLSALLQRLGATQPEEVVDMLQESVFDPDLNRLIFGDRMQGVQLYDQPDTLTSTLVRKYGGDVPGFRTPTQLPNSVVNSNPQSYNTTIDGIPRTFKPSSLQAALALEKRKQMFPMPYAKKPKTARRLRRY